MFVTKNIKVPWIYQSASFCHIVKRVLYSTLGHVRWVKPTIESLGDNGTKLHFSMYALELGIRKISGVTYEFTDVERNHTGTIIWVGNIKIEPHTRTWSIEAHASHNENVILRFYMKDDDNHTAVRTFINIFNSYAMFEFSLCNPTNGHTLDIHEARTCSILRGDIFMGKKIPEKIVTVCRELWLVNGDEINKEYMMDIANQFHIKNIYDLRETDILAIDTWSCANERS